MRLSAKMTIAVLERCTTCSREASRWSRAGVRYYLRGLFGALQMAWGLGFAIRVGFRGVFCGPVVSASSYTELKVLAMRVRAELPTGTSVG